MTWTELPFGKYTGMTLPQVLFKDPGWFFWAHTRPLHGTIAYEVGVLHPKATRIRVPGAVSRLLKAGCNVSLAASALQAEAAEAGAGGVVEVGDGQDGRFPSQSAAFELVTYSVVLPSKCSWSASASWRVWWTTPSRWFGGA
jgi:hypothetical protein